MLEKDPAYSWGMIFFLSGLLQLTLMPYLAYLKLLYPDDYFFTVPGSLLLVLSMVLFFFAKDEYKQKTLIIGGGLLFFGVFELVIYPERNNNYYFIVYGITALAGILIMLAAYNPLRNKLREVIETRLLEVAALISIGLVINAIFWLCIN